MGVGREKRTGGGGGTRGRKGQKEGMRGGETPTQWQRNWRPANKGPTHAHTRGGRRGINTEQIR